jgi:signal transduction histidine kinase
VEPDERPAVRLSTFLRQHRDEVVGSWVAFADSMLSADQDLGRDALRDHAEALVLAIADDMDAVQSSAERQRKPSGDEDASRMGNVAAVHAKLRIDDAFRLEQLVAEFRALRASVVRLWERTLPEDGAEVRDELTRFHEAIDQALVQSVARYASRVAEVREQFLGILGHDLRNPIGAIRVSAQLLERSGDLTHDGAYLVGQIGRSAERMSRMVSDVLDLARSRLGGRIRLHRVETDLADVVLRAAEELAAFHPDRRIVVEGEGDLTGSWDRERIAQVVSNLVGNALEHGEPTSTITVRLRDLGADVRFDVHNLGAPLAPDALEAVLEASRSREAHPSATGHVGLGLFIVRQIVAAHGGEVTADSDAVHGTRIGVVLPRHEPQAG